MANIDPLQAVRNTWTETEFQSQLLTQLRGRGFTVAHFRAVRALRANGTTFHSTPVQADGAGFPDLVVVGHGRHFFVELKAQGKYVKKGSDQERWIDLLRGSGATVFVWKPRQWSEIMDLLDDWAGVR